jgi:16S rRNA (cytosine1402-N4)-methyltransferase
MCPTFTHQPVMAARVVELLAPALARPGAVYCDLTLGLGGHAALILERCPEAQLVGFDRDGEALALAGERLARFGGRVTLVHAVFDRFAAEMGRLGLHADAVLLDLGLSSLQIDDTARGFAYAADAPLDMRMDPTAGETAADLVNTLPQTDLARLLRSLADERFAARIARAIVQARAQEPFTTSARLAAVVAGAIPAAARQSGGHPAKRTFQALRMAVNGERETLQAVLPQVLAGLSLGGRAAVLSYHSGEDRLVKQAFAAAASDRVPPGLAEVPAHLAAEFRLLTHGAERPAAAETEANPRSASARLRAAERVQEAK